MGMKRFQSIGVLLSAITGLLVVLLVSVFAYSAKQAYDRRESAASLLKTVDVLSDVFSALEALRLEQGEIGTALLQPAPADAAMRSRLEKLHKATEEARARTRRSSRLEADGPTANGARIAQRAEIFEKKYAEAMSLLGQPLAARPATFHRDWAAAVNDLFDAVNRRTRVRSVYIADASAFNNVRFSPRP